MNQDELNAKLYALVQQWCATASLVISGVNLADCMAYDALSVLGRQIVNSLPAGGQPGSPFPEEVKHG